MANSWNYESPTPKSTGYEDLYPVLSQYTSARYKSSTPEEQARMVDEVFQIYRDRGIFPITYYNQEGLEAEVRECVEYRALVRDCVVGCGAGVGTGLCNFMMPNLFDASNQGDALGSARDKFNNDHALKRAVRFALQCDRSAMPKSVMAGIRNIGAMPTNFRPMNAKALYDEYCPKNAVIHDSSCGFGGRLLGALSSKYGYRYVGTEPNSETVENLNRLGSLVEGVTRRKNSFKIVKMGSEEFRANPEIFDFSFTSPPYFDLEHYTDEPTQCYVKFPNVYDWIDHFVKPTIENTYSMLKHGRYYAVNIADFKTSTRVVNYVDIWGDLAEKAGFKHVKDLMLKVPIHAGTNKTRGPAKGERIMLFRKD